ncbi:hypothetical protein CO115_00455 [Candidatus Falkowbacteria bacterium CG_4_9_14_3_um_filter_36_9]|uniref:Glycosyltransferase 2-like domain-containing protein n=2 Tax=Candidatus Falkowiibacteriota TaxID=1752728 RepID=A0A1J4T7N0_9BACT|nr:MAG: hypothetical protein AUJ27_01225 [Candidatus Falkowbacteria bacterium CG1_02_37_44]PIV51671.1 MAG: hypothetical protein COS18_02335 [Candidatus Falkowbacteria bacterium CG02_land_8_20_14_3_00_36_14]PIX11758.1 MAG: hypothetical protein COZ73_01860 [Candidatus Falkowbacteria bacterium CG_4_8_14_3_um_filter_36_11]PJA10702.1 MAG: hypothetical protein COX67_03690 [Candidatus Falkowbacteria bacterium CG_4_10_14_0_2_um_filter_36_22]PJB20786.1 MAG: hypothetical protein CO115_00455 [Candidatus F
MISIIIPVYNQADKLPKCLDSILNQTYNNYEIIIVDDGSTDNLNITLEKYKNIFSYKLNILEQENKGANSARNHGYKSAKGEYLLFCDADLVLQANMMAIMLKTLKDNQSASYAYSSFRYGFKIFKLWPFSPERLKIIPFIHTTSLIRREHFSGFDENIKKLQDWDLWLTMLAKGHAGIWINKVLFKVQTGGTMSAWLPSGAYKLLPFLPEVKKYNQALSIIKQKHSL